MYFANFNVWIDVNFPKGGALFLLGYMWFYLFITTFYSSNVFNILQWVRWFNPVFRLSFDNLKSKLGFKDYNWFVSAVHRWKTCFLKVNHHNTGHQFTEYMPIVHGDDILIRNGVIDLVKIWFLRVNMKKFMNICVV